jgi:hypothetical protein
MTPSSADLDDALEAVQSLHPTEPLRRASIAVSHRRLTVPPKGRIMALAKILEQAGAQACWLWQTAEPVHADVFRVEAVTGVLLAAEAVIDGASAMSLRHIAADDWMVSEVREVGDGVVGAVPVIAQDGGRILIEGQSRAYGFVRYYGFDDGRARPVATRFVGYGPTGEGERR